MEYPSDIYDTSVVEFSVLLNKTLSKIDVFRDFAKEGDLIAFTVNDGDVYYMTHQQEDSEKVYLCDMIGSFDDLVDTPILQAEKSTNSTPRVSRYTVDDLNMWTFYKLATLKGYMPLCWRGTSNGYYSVGVSFLKLEKENDE